MTTISYPSGDGNFVAYGTPEWEAYKARQDEIHAQRIADRDQLRLDEGWNGGVDPYGWTYTSTNTPAEYRYQYEQGNPLGTYQGGTKNYGSIAGSGQAYDGPPQISAPKPQAGIQPGPTPTYGTMQSKSQPAQTANSPYIGSSPMTSTGTQAARFSPMQKAGYIQTPQQGPQISEGGPLAMQMAQAMALRG